MYVMSLKALFSITSGGAESFEQEIYSGKLVRSIAVSVLVENALET